MGSLSTLLHLETPRLQPNAVPWAANDDVTFAAVLSTDRSASSPTIVDLPCTVDIENLTQLADASRDDEHERVRRLFIGVRGNDHGMGLTLGAGILELPNTVKPHLNQLARTPCAFRVRLVDSTGASTGVMHGSLQRRRKAFHSDSGHLPNSNQICEVARDQCRAVGQTLVQVPRHLAEAFPQV